MFFQCARESGGIIGEMWPAGIENGWHGQVLLPVLMGRDAPSPKRFGRVGDFQTVSYLLLLLSVFSVSSVVNVFLNHREHREKQEAISGDSLSPLLIGLGCFRPGAQPGHITLILR